MGKVIVYCSKHMECLKNLPPVDLITSCHLSYSRSLRVANDKGHDEELRDLSIRLSITLGLSLMDCIV